jgi:hypothetical protein
MSRLRLPSHEGTTAQIGAAYPFAAEPPLPVDKVLVGRDRSGAMFCHDPFTLYQEGVVTNPNMLVLGQIGRGKSAFVKSYCYRQVAFGRRLFVLDPKGEYGELARRCDTVPIALGPGRSTRVNPLGTLTRAVEPSYSRGPVTEMPPTRRRAADLELGRSTLLVALASAALRRPLAPREHAAAMVALQAATVRPSARLGHRASMGGRLPLHARRTGGIGAEPLLQDVVVALLDPDPEQAREVGVPASVLAEEGRDLGLCLQRLVSGDLRGMFDGPTSPGVDPTASVVVVDLSSVYHSSGLAVVMACAISWIQSVLAARERVPTILVLDEAWALLADLATARFLQSSFKLARSLGVANLAVLHRISDLHAAGDGASEHARLAEGLLADVETVVCYGQPPSEVAEAERLLGLGATESALLSQLGRGLALWRVGGRPYLVEHLLSSAERALVDTDARMMDR